MKQTVLVTGGTGFLGRALGKALQKNYEVVLAGRNNKQNAQAHGDTGCRVFPLDVSHIESVRDVVVETKPDIIIHAAATKFVDLAERQPMECLDVNVVGSQNVARVAIDRGVSAVIGISTDKASPPVRNTYGLSKALMERLFCSMDGKSGTRFACVRYGNVAWSTGSVLPVWKSMHDEANIIRTTGPEMRRFFFTVDEAVALVQTALVMLQDIHGMVLSRIMKAAQIGDLLEVWIAQKGGRWERMEGRPGERTDEYLIGEAEVPYTREIVVEGIRHFLVDFNQRADRPVPGAISSATTERLSVDEMISLLQHGDGRGL